MTDAEIKKALEKAINEYAAEDVGSPEYFKLIIAIFDLFNRKQAEIEELTQKLECLLCHATGSKLSKSTYSLRTMEIAVNDEVQQCCEEVQAEAIKEFAERLKQRLYACPDVNTYAANTHINNLVKEMVGDAE